MDRASASGAEGHRFESCIPYWQKGPELLGSLPVDSGPFVVSGRIVTSPCLDVCRGDGRA